MHNLAFLSCLCKVNTGSAYSIKIRINVIIPRLTIPLRKIAVASLTTWIFIENKEGLHKLAGSETGFVTHNALCFPISKLDGAKVTGVIQMLNKNNKESFDDQDL